ncbi:MAG: hypothetical protein ACRCV3_04020 [Desulfovibrionaceae bacterium]
MLQSIKKNNLISQKTIPLELVYAECYKCAAPLLWNKKQSLQVIQALKISEETISASNMFLSEGCPCCSAETEFFSVKLIDVTKQEYNHTISQQSWTAKK